jgi:pilus assembly protein CpaE
MARLDEAFLQGVLARHASGLAVLPSVDDAEELGLLTPACVEQTIALLQTSFDYIVLDSGHTLDDITVTALALAPLFLVTTPALPVLRHTKRFLDLLRTNLEYTPDNINVIVNRYKSKYQEVSVAELQEVLQQKPVWWLPNDYYTTSRAINRGEPLTSVARHAKITRSLQGLAASLAAEDSKKPSLFSRFFRHKEA